MQSTFIFIRCHTLIPLPCCSTNPSFRNASVCYPIKLFTVTKQVHHMKRHFKSVKISRFPCHFWIVFAQVSQTLMSCIWETSFFLRPVNHACHFLPIFGRCQKRLWSCQRPHWDVRTFKSFSSFPQHEEPIPRQVSLSLLCCEYLKVMWWSSANEDHHGDLHKVMSAISPASKLQKLFPLEHKTVSNLNVVVGWLFSILRRPTCPGPHPHK